MEEVKEEKENVVSNKEGTDIKNESKISKKTENKKTVSLEEKYEESLQKIKKLQEDILSTIADGENYKKQVNKSCQNYITSTFESFFLAFFPLFDDCHRIQKEEITSIDTLKKGLDLIYQNFLKAFERVGIIPLAVSIGDSLDTKKHEAIAEVKVKNEEEDGKVVEVISQGWKMNEKVLKVAQVVIGNYK